MSTFAELFSFLAHERADVRKMALEGIATNSMNNHAMISYLRDSPEEITKLVELLHIREQPLLGQLLSTLVNLASDEEMAVALCARKCINRAIRLFDGLERAASTDTSAALTELVLMLLNNLTASHKTAVLDLLQVDDEDLQGYNLSLLKTHFDRTSEDSERNRRHWYLNVCLNLTRCGEGQAMIVNDDDWFDAIVEIVNDGKDKKQVSLAIQIAHHCCAQKELVQVVASKKLPAALANRSGQLEGFTSDVQLAMMETVEALMSDERGMQALEEVNAKKFFMDYTNNSANPASVRSFVRDQLLPFMDDINDVYVMGGDAEAADA